MVDLEIAVGFAVYGNNAGKGALGNNSVLPRQRPDVFHRYIVKIDPSCASGRRPRLCDLHPNHTGDEGYCSQCKGQFLHLICLNQKIVFLKNTINKFLLLLPLQGNTYFFIHQ